MRRSDGSQFASGDLLVGRFLRMVFGGSHFISDVEPPAAVVSGGGGDITSVTATAPLTGGGSAGDVSIGLTLTADDIPDISAAKITSGQLNANQIPDLSANKISDGTLSSGLFPASRPPHQSLTQTAYDALTPSSGHDLPDYGIAMALRLLIADVVSDELYEINPDGLDTEGSRLRAFPSGLTHPGGMTVFNGRLLIADDDR